MHFSGDSVEQVSTILCETHLRRYPTFEKSCLVQSSSPGLCSLFWPWIGNIPSAVLQVQPQARSNQSGGWHYGGGDCQGSNGHSQSGWKGWNTGGSNPLPAKSMSGCGTVICNNIGSKKKIIKKRTKCFKTLGTVVSYNLYSVLITELRAK